MDEIALQKTMTTKELADTLHVDRRTINKKLKMVRSCKGDASQIKVGVPSHITEVEAVEIKKSLGIHNLERSFQVQKVVSTLERQQTIALAYKYLTEDISVLKQQNEQLKIQLDESKQYMTVKRMEAINQGMHFNWRQLKAESERIGKPSKDVFDANYGTVKAYHVDVWEGIYYDSINYPQ